MLETID